MKIFKRLSIAALAIAFMFSLSGSIAVLAASPATVNLGSASNFTILAKTGISTTGTTSIIGNLGISPAAASYITGFGLILPAAGAFSTSALVTGNVYAPGYANPTPTNLTTAILDMQNAYTDAMGRASTVTELGAGNIGGLTLASGVYKWSTGLIIPTDVTLSGSANDVWIFQIAQNLNISSATKVILSGGAQASNIFWVVAGQTTIGTTAVFNGNILDQTSIVLNTGATLNGRALAQSAVTLDSSTVTVPAASSSSNNGTNANIGGGLYPSGGTTGTIAQSTTPVTVQVSPTVTMTTTTPGCSGGNMYNTSTGALCMNNVGTQITGCGNRTSGFSTATGQSCIGNVSNASVNSYNFGTTTLKNGSKGSAVMELQKFLNQVLNLGLVVDGKLGPKTIAVIKKWQKDNGLVADGLIGAKTKAKMNASIK